MARSSNFNDAARARIFARDHAICSFSGKSLWILDWGASYLWEMDWADHIKPVSRGGGSTADNGVSASYSMNVKKGNNSRDKMYFFRDGHATADFYRIVGRVPAETAHALLRQFKESDWYFNRGLAHVLIAVENIALDFEADRTRKASMWAKAAVKMLSRWRHLSGGAGYADLRLRGLIPKSPTLDQRRLMDLRDSDSPVDVVRAIHDLVPYYRDSFGAIDELGRVRTRAGAARLLRRVRAKQRLSPALKKMVRDNIELLFPG